MNKTAIKNYAIEARKKLISEITYRAGLVGITKRGIAEPIHKADGIEMYDIGSSDPYTIKGEQVKQRKSLALKVKEKGFDNVIEEVAYTWFNRIIAIRFMEVNDYLPTRVRVLSSETTGKVEPDIVTEAPNIDLGLTSVEIDEILQLKHDNKLDELFRMLFVRQCNALNAVLPELFEKTSDYTELLLSISYTNDDSIVRLLNDSIKEEDFNINVNGQVEIIGWLYQYYNTELKDDTFSKLKANVKIAKECIPAATQLFTPGWIVKYMVENSVGRLWIERLESSYGYTYPIEYSLNDSEGKRTIDVLKDNWKYYLEDSEQSDDVLFDIEKIRESYRDIRPEDIKIIDPCMGSGHILVYAFEVIMDIYKSCGYDEREAARLIIQKNLHGFDIDCRAYQLAYFAVMMKARSYNRRILNDSITHNLSLSYAFDKTKYAIDVANHIIDKTELDMNKSELKDAIIYLLNMNEDVSEFGSLVNMDQLDFDKIEDAIEKLSKESIIGDFKNILPLLKQAKILSQKYDVVITNPPYMGNKGMSTKLSSYVQENYPDSKSDLFAVFIERCAQMNKSNGFQAMITQHSWMFLSSYEKLRQKLILKDIINMAHLGSRAFEEISGEVVQTTAFILRNSNIECYNASYVRLIDYDNAQIKEEMFLKSENRHTYPKVNFSKIPGTPLAYWVSKNIIRAFKEGVPLIDLAKARQGMASSDNKRFVRSWHEVSITNLAFGCKNNEEAINSNRKWFPYNNGGEYRKWYGCNFDVVNWEKDGYEVKEYAASLYKSYTRTIKSISCYFNKGATWNAITGSGQLSVRYFGYGYIFSNAGMAAFEENSKFSIEMLIGYLNSKVTYTFLQCLSPTLNFNQGDIARIPIIFNDSKKSCIIKLVTENISLSKVDWDSYETSWDFSKHPFLNLKGKTIDQSFNNWERFAAKQFYKLKANEEELNFIFIEIYGFQDEITPEVDEKDVTIRKADLERDIKSFISYAVGCMLGRYSLDIEGLAYAGGEWDSSKYKTYTPDADNVIPITDEEYFNDDIVGRFIEFVKISFGADTLEENLDFIANALGNKGNTSREVIRQYFIKDFYKYHVKTYQKKPIYWLFDSGKENGFKALIYMHRYNQDTVGRVRVDYLHRIQKAIESAISRADMVIEGSTNPSQKAKAVKEKEKLVKQLAETRIYDAAIGHIAAQRIAIDLDDGVAVNYAKFQGVEVSSEGKKASKIDLLGKI